MLARQSWRQGRDRGRRVRPANLWTAVRTHWPFLRDRRIDAYGDDHDAFIWMRSSVMSSSQLTSDRALGYRMPAEWEPHAGDLALLAAQAKSWPGQVRRQFRGVFAQIVRHLVAIGAGADQRGRTGRR